MNTETIKLKKLKKTLEGCFCITDENIFALYKEYLPDDTYVLPCGEAWKNFSTVEKIIQQMLKRKIDRSGVLAAVGGGVIGDIGGFVASVYKRGIDWICVPTTITAFADSSIGGKTGISCGGVKNAVGSFYEPVKRLVAYEFLNTLSKTQIKDGMAEVYKTALFDLELMEMLASATLSDILDKCAEIKTQITDSDFFDKGIRRALNMGHTIGHALESVYGLSHGQSVALGLYIESCICGLTSGVHFEFIKEVAALYKTDYKTAFKWDAEKIAQAAANDKKNNGSIAIIAPVDFSAAEIFEFSYDDFVAKLQAFIDTGGNDICL